MKILKILIYIIFIVFLSTNTLYAHDILPSEVYEFLDANPDATDEDVQNYLKEKYGGDIIFDNNVSFVNQINEKVNKVDKDLEKFRYLNDDNVSLLRIIKYFTALGVKHILGGLDHILFLFALLLTLFNWKKILQVITVFTIAHSITLILAGFEIFTLSSRIVETIIAFSIAYVTFTSIFLKNIKSLQGIHTKLMIVFTFGLFHGMGFADIFKELNISKHIVSSLVSFNVGVEIGQIFILLVTFPILYLVRKKEEVYDAFVKIIGLSIMILSLFWLYQRLFL